MKKILSMFPFYSKKKLLLSFEYGIVLADVAKEMGQHVTPEMVMKAEEMIINEFSQKSPTRLAVEMTPNLLAMFEVKDVKLE